jgi:hypothetical protein
MLIFIYGLEEYTMNMIDGSWYDMLLALLYSGMAFLFYRAGGLIQFALTSTGAILHAWYWYVWGVDARPLSLFYSEIFVTLTIFQLLAASKGMLWSVLYKRIQGGNYGTRRNSHGLIWHITHWHGS